MENNIFEGAEFGDKFLTRDGSKLMFVHYLEDIDAYHCVLENWYETLDYAPNGKAFEKDNHHTDIVSRYQEPIDEEKLDELAIESMNKSIFNDPNKNYCGCDTAYYYGFVAGYRKAMEEKV